MVVNCGKNELAQAERQMLGIRSEGAGAAPGHRARGVVRARAQGKRLQLMLEASLRSQIRPRNPGRSVASAESSRINRNTAAAATVCAVSGGLQTPVASRLTAQRTEA
jgi:hypothetical protein